MKIKKKRIQSIFIIFVIWFFITVIYLFYFSIYARYEYLNNSKNISFREGRIPATRGTIFDKNGKKLASNKNYFNLYLNSKYTSIKKGKDLLKKLNKIFPNIKNIKYLPIREILIKEHINPDELNSIDHLLISIPELTVKLQQTRAQIKITKVAEYIGTAKYINGKWVGLSGIEKKFNDHLSGRDGIYTVMQDKNKKWIKGTLKRKFRVIPGKDLNLKISLNDIIKHH